MQGVPKNAEDFNGIELFGLPNVEMFRSCAWGVFSAESNDEFYQICGELLNQIDSVQLDLQTKVIDLLLVESHPCLIIDLSRLYRSFKCLKSHRYFSTM